MPSSPHTLRYESSRYKRSGADPALKIRVFRPSQRVVIRASWNVDRASIIGGEDDDGVVPHPLCLYSLDYSPDGGIEVKDHAVIDPTRGVIKRDPSRGRKEGIHLAQVGLWDFERSVNQVEGMDVVEWDRGVVVGDNAKG